MNRDNSSLFQQDEFKESLAKYEEMLTSGKPVYLDADQFADIAEYYASKDEYGKSLAAIDYSKKMHPGNADILTMECYLLLEIGEIEQAEQHIRSLTGIDEYEYGYLNASLLVKLGKAQEAQKKLHEIAETEETDENFYLDAGYLFMDNNYPEEALQWLKLAHEANPQNAETIQDYAECLFRCQRIQEAVNWYNRALDIDPYAYECWFGLGKAYSLLGDHAKSLESLDFALAIKPDYQAAILMEGYAYFHLGNFKKSGKYYLDYAIANDDNAQAYYMAGICQYNLGNNEDALKYFYLSEEKERQAPDMYTADLYRNIAICHSDRNEFDKALAAIDTALKYETEEITILKVIKGTIYLKMRNTEKAEQLFEEALQADSYNNPEIFLQIAVAYFDNVEVTKSILMFKEIEKRFPDNQSPYMFLAYTYFKLREKEEFRKYFIKTMEKAPESFDFFIKNYLNDEPAEIKQQLLNLKDAYENNKPTFQY